MGLRNFIRVLFGGENRKVGNSVSDETMLYFRMFTGMAKPGQEYFIRENGHLYRAVYQGGLSVSSTDLGRQDTPENLRIYYQDRRDATLVERLKMALF